MTALINPNEKSSKPLIKTMPMKPYGSIPKRNKNRGNKKKNVSCNNEMKKVIFILIVDILHIK